MKRLEQIVTADEALSYVSPSGRQYETYIDSQMDVWLARHCGLTIVAGSRRGIPSSAAGAGSMQWDGRFSVMCTAGWRSVARSLTSDFYVYGDYLYYQRPPAKLELRKLSPNKEMNAQYFAVLEYSRWGDWTHSWVNDQTPPRSRSALPPRLEKRLAVCCQRAREAWGSTEVPDVLDVVAVVGVVGEDSCLEAVEELLRAPTAELRLLKKMHQAGRFVFMRCLFAVTNRVMPCVASHSS